MHDSITPFNKYTNLPDRDKEEIVGRFVQFSQLLKEFCSQYEREETMVREMLWRLRPVHWKYAEGFLGQEELLSIFEILAEMYIRPLWLKADHCNHDSVYRIEIEISEVFGIGNTGDIANQFRK